MTINEILIIFITIQKSYFLMKIFDLNEEERPREKWGCEE